MHIFSVFSFKLLYIYLPTLLNERYIISVLLNFHKFPNSSEPRENQCSSSSTNNTSIKDSNPLIILQSFPQELINEILLRLPVKSLLKFKCVSRSWLSLISSPQFIKTHFQISSSKAANLRLLMWSIFQGHYYLRQCSLNSVLYDQVSDGIDLQYPTGNIDRYVSYVGDYNGLICICIGENDLFLWNPSVRKSEKFPSFDIKLNEHEYEYEYVAYYAVFGFGYDEANDDYIVVCIICLLGNLVRPSGEVKVYICSIKSKSWKKIGYFEGGYPWKSNRGVFLNGKLHWALDKTGSGCIVSLDLATEEYGRIEEPNYEKGKGKLGIFEGCLCLVVLKNVVMAEVWIMKEYGVKESWTLIVAIPCKPMRSLMSIPLCVSTNDEFLIVLGRELGLYNTKNNSFKHVKDFFGTIYTASLFVESLFLPSGDGAA